MGHFELVEQQTQSIYERNAEAFDVQRPKRLHERAWLDRFLMHVPPNGRILDVGCGAGDPIAAFFLESGYRVTGVDFSQPMLDLARRRLPEGDWREFDMRSLDLDDRFHGLIAWNSFFHLNPDDQRSTLRIFAKHLLPEGVMMLTVGPEAGEVIGHVNGEEVYHSSLATEEYTAILDTQNIDVIEFVAEDERCDMQTVLVAKVRS